MLVICKRMWPKHGEEHVHPFRKHHLAKNLHFDGQYFPTKNTLSPFSFSFSFLTNRTHCLWLGEKEINKINLNPTNVSSIDNKIILNPTDVSSDCHKIKHNNDVLKINIFNRIGANYLINSNLTSNLV